MFISCIFADFRGRGAYLDLSQTHSFLAKILKAVKFFRKSSILNVDWVPNTPLEGFVQNFPEKELAIAPFKKCLTATAWQNYH